jgi:hypothetical protein
MANAIRCAREDAKAEAVFNMLDRGFKEIDILDIQSLTSEQFQELKAKWEIEKASPKAAPTSQEDENA